MMIAAAFWRRIDVLGRDAARVSEADGGFQLLGHTVFLDPRGPTALRYVLNLARDWSTLDGHISGFIGDRQETIASRGRLPAGLSTAKTAAWQT